MRTDRFYRSPNADILGVCHGFAEWRDLPVQGVQLGVIILALCTAVVPCLIAYFVLAAVLPERPEDYEYFYKDGFRDYFRRRTHKKRKKDFTDYDFDEMRRKARDNNEDDWEARFHKAN